MRAKAAIIRPFQAVSTLSSRCGRGRSSRAANIASARAVQDASTISSRRLSELPRRARRPTRATYSRFLPVNSCCGSIGALPSGSIAEPPLDDGRVVAEQRVDLVGAPEVERAFRLVRRPDRRPAPAGRCRRPRPSRSRRPRRSSRAARTAACPRRPRGRTDRRTPAPPSTYASTSCAWSYSIFSKCGTRQARVDRVAVKAAADVIAHAAERHRPQRRAAPSSRASASPVRACSRSRNSSSLGRGNFGASPKPPCRASNDCRNCATVRVERVGAGHVRGRRAAARAARSCAVSASADSRDLLALGPPHPRDLLQDVDEPRPAPPRRRRKVGAAVERLQLRRQPDAHRPAARSGRRLHERHVDAIDVGPLLAIDLDRHEVLVQHARRPPSFSNDSCSITWHQWHVE